MRVLTAGLIVLLVAGCASSNVPTYTFDWQSVYRYVPFLVQGLAITAVLTVINLLTGLTLGVFVAFARMARLAPLRAVAIVYIEFFRGTPLLVQLIWAYYALPIVLGLSLPALVAVSVALTLNVGAFAGEAFRSGIQAVPKEHIESAEVLGLRYFQRMRYVVLPQAVRVVLPVLISLAIGLFKDTSLVSFVGVNDLMYNGVTAAVQTYRPLEILTTVALMYFGVAFPLTIVMRRVEIYFNRHQA
jgi:polar amino acid transport system permease protein